MRGGVEAQLGEEVPLRFGDLGALAKVAGWSGEDVEGNRSRYAVTPRLQITRSRLPAPASVARYVQTYRSCLR